MKTLRVNQIRSMFLEFFKSKEHLVVESYSLIPQNDNSLLLINSGMAPMKPFFTGQEIPPSKRVASCQKCIRTGDIENVGKTSRHLTFFEMLGNFSFGDYFKKESLLWSWEFLTEKCGLPADRLYPSVYYEDEEAYQIWLNEIGIPADKITKFYRDENGDCDNFWEHGAGPCGPCSEIYFDRGEQYGCGSSGCRPGCECDRFIEVWNNVFTQFESDGNHHYTELKQKNIDTGMGLERLAVVLQGVDSVYDIDTMQRICMHVSTLSGISYGLDKQKDSAIRLIADHIRSVTFMASDGIMPSNEGRGYVLRRLLRRAARFGRLLGIKGLFLSDLCETVVAESQEGYPELSEKKEFILKILTVEEEKFSKTIDQGLSILNDMAAGLIAEGKNLLAGEDAFKLYDTYGFPIDLTVEIMEEKGFEVDLDAFRTCMKKQQDTARNARAVSNYMGADATVYDSIDVSITSVFHGYDKTERQSKISVLTTDTELVDKLLPGQTGTIIVEETPFYAAMGGQAGDTGILTKNGGKFIVEDTIKLKGGRIGHAGYAEEGFFRVGDIVDLAIDIEKRNAVCKNHSATHLLHEALKQVLGNHVEQAGSYVAFDRLRFDFTHFSAMTEEEIRQTEALVNAQIAKNLAVITNEMNIEDAKKTGAKALFGEKYTSLVRVVCMGEFSKELCGGTHVLNTGSISVFKLLSETGIAAGVRRIEAVTGEDVFRYFRRQEENLHAAAKALKTEPDNILKKIESILDEMKLLRSENEKLKAKLAGHSLMDILQQVIEVDGVKILSAKVMDVDMNGLRNLCDQLKEKMGGGVIFLASVLDGKVNLAAAASEDAVKRGAHAGNMIKEAAACVGGGGGGRPDMAQAGGKNPAGIDASVQAAAAIMKKQLGRV